MKLVSGNLWSPTCSTDGRFVFYVNTEQPQKIWRIPVEGGTPAEIADILGSQMTSGLSVSPNGGFLAYGYTKYGHVSSSGWNLCVIHAVGGTPVKTFDFSGGSWGLRWSPNGKGLQYLLNQNDATNLWEQPLAGGKPKQLTTFTSGQIFDFNWSADGKQLLITRGETTSDVVMLSNLH